MEKVDLLNAICCHGEEAIDEIMETSARKLVDAQNLPQMLITGADSIASAIHKLTASHHQCLLIIDDAKKLLGVVSYADIMAYIERVDKCAVNNESAIAAAAAMQS